MPPLVRLVLAIHDHQPVGNFDHVFENNFKDSYLPFLEIMEEFHDIKINLHTSGSLIEWLVEKRPDYIERIRKLVQRGQVEILGGPFYEPILACIPRRDRVGQIKAYTQYLENLFNTPVRGIWIPERVWEQSFASDIVEAGIEYSIVDDFHFKCAGLAEKDLHGYYLTEDNGRLLKMFPVAERMRYIVPFGEPEEAIDYLRMIGEQNPGTIVSFGDDGEKFGSWPGTQEHVYQNGWLRRFFDILRQNSDWVKVSTMSSCVDEVSPMGRCYLPDASYREMTEWALNSDRQTAYHALNKAHETDEDWPQIRQYMRGASWRNFLVKYSENNEMYCRMWEVSRKLEAVETTPQGQMYPHLVEEARTELYRAQCNCPYWHGAFGGLYLPHLRNAIFQHLIAADNILEQLNNEERRWVEIRAEDYNFDARQEVKLSSHRLAAYVSPALGGHLYELDLRVPKHNLLATLNRRVEPYHEKIIQFAEQAANQNPDELVKVLHENIRFKQPDLHLRIGFDNWPRKSLVDHFLKPGVSLEDFRNGHGVEGDFATGVYQSRIRRSDKQVELILSREGIYQERLITISKTISLSTDQSSSLEVTYTLSNLAPGQQCHFGVEWNFAGMAAGADDRYFYNSEGTQSGQLQTIHDWTNAERIGLVDEWLGVDASLDVSQPASIWTFPIETVSQSESGFELVHQSTTVVPHWEFTAPADGTWTVKIRLVIDTSMREARNLREAAANNSAVTAR
jgi:alpha-amylase